MAEAGDGGETLNKTGKGAMAEAGEEQEAMLERLLTRLALTDDSKLEPVLAKLLPYAISCLGTPRQSTKQKVMDMLSHINKRVKDQPSIKLPLLDLLRLYQSEKAAPMVKSFSLVYMEMSFDRRSKDEADLAPDLLVNLSKISPQHQDILLRMTAKELEKYASDSMDEICAAKYTIVKNPADWDIFSDFCLQTILYQYQSASLEGSSRSPAGLSKLQALRVSGKFPLNGDSLVNRKVGLLNVIAELNMPAETIYPLLIAASVDSNDRVSKRAEELLKKKAAGVNLEDPMLVKKLFSIFQGTLGSDTTTDARVSPASPALKSKLMSVFTHSIAAANSFPATLHCIFDCIYGTESFSRLKQSGMEFTVWVFKHARDEQIKPMAPIILSGILKLLDNPTPGEADTSTRQLRMFAYQAIGQLGQRAPHLFRDSTDIAMRLFEAFKIEHPALRFTVQEAVTSVASAYKGCSEVVAKQIDALLLRNVFAVEGEARFCSVWWAKNIYDYTHCASRFICMLGASDERLDVRNMALEGLMPPKQDGSKKTDYPFPSNMLDIICNQQPGLLTPATMGEQELLFQSKTYEAMIMFLLRCYEGCDHGLSFEERFVLLLEHGMASNGSIDLHARASDGLLMIASKAPKKFAEFYLERIRWLRQFIGHIDMSTRETVARLLGIVSSGLPTSTTVVLLEDLRVTFHAGQKSRFEDMHGAVCATGYILAQCMVGVPTVPLETIQTVLSTLVKLGRSGNPVLSGAVVEAIGHVGLRGPLPISQDNKQRGADDHMEAAAGFVTDSAERMTSTSVTQLFNDIISLKDMKSLQKAVIAYGQMCYGNPDKELLEEALNALFGLSRSKVEEVLFVVGEALCFIWGGLSLTADEILKTTFVSLSSTSNFLSDHVDVCDSDMESIPVTGESNNERARAREVIVSKLFDELLYSGRKEERCAGAVWLVSIITYCGKHPRVQQMLPEIQEAFSHLLGEQNELTQEMASKGMSILYELGDTASRHELVKALVSTLSGTVKKKRAIKLTEDSEVFEEGSLGEKPGGGNITTYKELCSLANEMGQPDLIYKFMDLANHQASLNSKRGAAFGFAKIAMQARDALSPYIPVLVPKLIRYQYDPNKLVQDAMGHIWRSIIPEPKKTVDEFFDVIMEDLLLQAGSRLWRSRESSCLALADILQGRRFQEVEKYLEQIWVVCFRAMDDIKETVRTAAIGLSRSVSSLTLRFGDTQLTAESDARTTVNLVLPVLLSKGIMSNIADVQRLSINTVMKLAKTAGSSIRAQLPDLVVCMLESLSSLEDQRLNYAELHADKAGISTEKLESLRVAVARESPMWETLDFCLQQVDGYTLEVLVPRLIQLVRTGVGLNTRVGLAKFISLLTQKVGSDMKKYAGALLKVLKTVSQEEKSPSSRRAFVSACATIAKHAGPVQIQSLFEDAVALYSTGAINAQITSALLLRELSLQASDAFVGYHTMVLPIAFIARFEDDKTVSNIFEEIWEENTSGQGVALQLYASDIIPLALSGLSSTSWTQKKKSAKAISKLAEAAGDSTAPFVQPLLRALLEELPNRLWEGKEVLLDALSAICKSCSGVIPESSIPNVINRHEVVAAVLAACSKKKITFRNAAFSCLEQMLLHFDDQALFEDVFAFLLQCCVPASSSKTSVQAHGEHEVDDTFTTSLEKVLICLKEIIASASSCVIRDKSETIVACLVEKMNGSYTWQVKLATLSTTQAFIKLLQKDELEGNNNRQTLCIMKSMELLILAILECLGSIKVGQVRVSCLECMAAMLETAHFRLHLVKSVGETLDNRMLILYELEKNASIKSLMQSVLTTLQSSMDMARTSI